ncbi:dihydroneopterin aldolase [Alteromonas gilva]|uniref:7,8-dihydroneopterin aldolase n=1 Tax=Alteromonas gilva TaxID=2987522 RepID=A0ABT5KYY9_9ALTE|nr:dihydroneopterin aldolase [Alteromonas gilva]MDC8829981.1 dihydroneopterin aldolase [Alteromonas gilva]
MQTIFIEGLQVPTLIGVYDWERTQETVLIVDLQINAHLEAAMKSDDVADTINYAAVAETVKQVGKDAQFELLEALGNAIIEAVCARFDLYKIVLRIEKPGILPDANKVGITISHEVETNA